MRESAPEIKYLRIHHIYVSISILPRWIPLQRLATTFADIMTDLEIITIYLRSYLCLKKQTTFPAFNLETNFEIRLADLIGTKYNF